MPAIVMKEEKAELAGNVQVIIKNDSDIVLPSRDLQSSGWDSFVDRQWRYDRVSAIIGQGNVISQKTDTGRFRE